MIPIESIYVWQGIKRHVQFESRESPVGQKVMVPVSVSRETLGLGIPVVIQIKKKVKSNTNQIVF